MNELIVARFCLALAMFACGAKGRVEAQVHAAQPGPDDRYKADILVVVAHPDDDTAAVTYIERAVLDEHKRVAVIFTNRGNSGPNAVGMEQAKALADVREMEARRSSATHGVTNIWFLNGVDTPTQDVLHSLETLGHGAALEEVVRLVRLTRPDVILTWLPAYVAGENHGDHQAAGVLATEAFDLANAPSAFGEQLEAPRASRGTGNYGEGLRPWQPKKIYYFSDATHPDFTKGRGPVYLASDVSRSKGIPFATMNRAAWEQYATQIDFDDKVLQYFVDQPDRFVLGKSLVPGAVTGDVWENAEAAPTLAPLPMQERAVPRELTVELGGPWRYYQNFYNAHRLDALRSLVPPESSLGTDRQLWVPLLLENHTGAAKDVTIASHLPAGWKEYTGPGVYHVNPGESYAVQIFLLAPEKAEGVPPDKLSWTATSGRGAVGTIDLTVYFEFDGVGQ